MLFVDTFNLLQEQSLKRKFNIKNCLNKCLGLKMCKCQMVKGKMFSFTKINKEDRGPPGAGLTNFFNFFFCKF